MATIFFFCFCCHVMGILHSDWLSQLCPRGCQLGLKGGGCTHSTDKCMQDRLDESHSVTKKTELSIYYVL